MQGAEGGAWQVDLVDGVSHDVCDCPDFLSNRLGTCKHLEAVLRAVATRASLRRDALGRRRREVERAVDEGRLRLDVLRSALFTYRRAAMAKQRSPGGAPAIPYSFVLDELAELDPVVRPMFGCRAVYVGERIVMILRKKGDADSGVWIATEIAHHDALRGSLPSMRSIGVLGGGVTAWQNLPDDGDDFEDEVLRACAMVRAGDPRIGRVPKAKSKGVSKRGTPKKTPKKRG